MTMRHRFIRLSRLDFFDAATALIVAALLILALLTFDQYAISNDEEVQHRYGELIVAYYTSGFVDRTLFEFKNLYLYGGLFDIVAVLFAKAFPIFDVFAIRHVLSALCGIGGIVATALTARLIAGPRTGTLAALMLAVCGVWYGGMFNHTKDIPFAAAMIGATYFLLRGCRDLPTPRWRDVLGFGLLAGMALGLRAIALLLAGYLLLAIVAQAFVTQDHWRARLQFALHAAVRFLPALALAYILMIAAWPWASIAPLNPIRAIFAFAHFHYSIRTIVAGQIFEMADVPRWYVPVYLAIKLPLLVLSGAIAAAAIGALRVCTHREKAALRDRETAIVAFIAVFPVLCQVVTEGPAFTGMRHFLFVVPAFAVLAAIAADAALNWLQARHRFALAGGIAIVGLGLLSPATALVRLHPYEHLFYNPLVGGLEGASRRFVMDYWVNILPEAMRDLGLYLTDIMNSEPGSDTLRYSVGVCGERIAFEHIPHPNLRWTDSWRDADFFVAPTHMDCDRALDGQTVATIQRLGVVIGVIKDRRAIVRPELARKP